MKEILKMKNNKIVLLTLLLLPFICLCISPGNASAAYDGGRLIDDPIFLDSESMSISDIQTFLSAKESGLASRQFVLNCYGQDSKERQWYSAAGAPCDQTVPASSIIYYASQIYGINPKVVLATLQKEQSLITSPNPTDWQLNQAMGYGCPTSGNCAGGSNFFYQIDSGTWVLRYHFERARGNMEWWTKSNSWTCGSAKAYYKPSLSPYQNVDFYDQDNVYYRKHYISTAATSSLYCYTPHAYNNPEGLYGLPIYGTTGRYYTGSYNFVRFFESWFGTTRTDGYLARFHSQSDLREPYYPGESKLSYIQYKNLGSARWYDDTSAPSGISPVHLAASNPTNRRSAFSYGWPSDGRPNFTFSRVYESDGQTLAANQHIVEPGQIARFEFNITPPWNVNLGTHREHFQPVLEGAQNWNMGGLAWLDVRVESRYAATFHSQSPHPSINQNDIIKNNYIRYKNTGSAAWYDITTVPHGYRATQLATTAPLNRVSSLSAEWPSDKRAARVFSKVYEADGTTLAGNQHIAMPGQIAEYNFTLTAGPSLRNGTYREYFQPILEGSPHPLMGGVSWLNVLVNTSTHKAQFDAQSIYPVLHRGESKLSYIQYKNLGSARWYDDTSAPSGISPVHLAASNPTNRRSAFSYGWPSDGRPNFTFSRVYESDGQTLAANQHIVEPGQIARFEFNITPPWNVNLGTHREHFQPVLEGAQNWNMGGLAWLDVRVESQ